MKQNYCHRWQRRSSGRQWEGWIQDTYRRTAPATVPTASRRPNVAAQTETTNSLAASCLPTSTLPPRPLLLRRTQRWGRSDVCLCPRLKARARLFVAAVDRPLRQEGTGWGIRTPDHRRWPWPALTIGDSTETTVGCRTVLPAVESRPPWPLSRVEAFDRWILQCRDRKMQRRADRTWAKFASRKTVAASPTLMVPNTAYGTSSTQRRGRPSGAGSCSCHEDCWMRTCQTFRNSARPRRERGMRRRTETSRGTYSAVETRSPRTAEKPDTAHTTNRVWRLSRSPPRLRVLARSQYLPFEGDSDSGHVLLLDCTLSLVLCGFSGCTVLDGCATSSTSCCHATFLLVHYCAPCIRM